MSGTKSRIIAAAVIALLSAKAEARLRLTAQASYVPSVRHISENDQTDYYDGIGYGGTLSYVKNVNEFILGGLVVPQTANYEDIDPGPVASDEIHMTLAFRRWLQGQRAFLQLGAVGIKSNTFDKSLAFGATMGGGLSWKLGRRANIGITNLFSLVPYTGYHRRFLNVNLELGVLF